MKDINLFILLAQIFLLSCSGYKHIVVKKTEFGDYKKLQATPEEEFQAEIVFIETDTVKLLRLDSVPFEEDSLYKEDIWYQEETYYYDTFPSVKLVFNNFTDSLVMVAFPFFWHRWVMKGPPFFSFRTLYPGLKLRMETFYPDKIDSLNNFIRGPIWVAIPPKEGLEVAAYITNSQDLYVKTIDNNVVKYNGEIEGSWNFQLRFKYAVVKPQGKINVKKLNEKEKEYRTNPITITF